MVYLLDKDFETTLLKTLKELKEVIEKVKQMFKSRTRWKYQ